MKNFIFKPMNNYLVYLKKDAIPPIEVGRLVSERTILTTSDKLFEFSSASENIYQNFEIEFPLEQFGGASIAEQDDNWGIGEKGLNLEPFWNKSMKGEGIVFGIADSGIDITIPTFSNLINQGRLLSFSEFDKNGAKIVQRNSDGTMAHDSQASPTFSHWHGTFCSAIIVGQNDGKNRGVAPDAKLVVSKVLQSGNIGSVASILSGLNWLADQNCDVVSLSLGWPGMHDVWIAPIQKMLANGVVIVAAIGNENGVPGVENTRSPANYPIANDIEKGLLLSVGAHDINGDVADFSGGGVVNWQDVKNTTQDGIKSPSVFSNFEPFVSPHLLGPGVDIVQPISTSHYELTSGSSMATPHIAGIIGLVLSAIRKIDTLATPRQAAELVLACVEPITKNSSYERSGAGLINSKKLFDKLETWPK